MLIMWDEALINNQYCFETLDKTLRDKMVVLAMINISCGKSILLGGYFHQILPVILGETKEDIINASLSSSPLLPKFTIMLLKQNMRLLIDGPDLDEVEEINAFLEWILKIGDRELCDLPFFDDRDESLLKFQMA